MTRATLKIPSFLTLPLRLVPSVVHSSFLTLVLNRVFADKMQDEELNFLRDRVVAIRVSDLGVEYRMTLKGDGFEAVPSSRETDVSIIGTAYEFMVLASRREDPDTLFFQRRLRIEGDTALGLELKNLLDSMDFDIPSMPKPIAEGAQRAMDYCEKRVSEKQSTPNQTTH